MLDAHEMAFGYRAELRAVGRLGIPWIQVCCVLENLVEDLDWAALDHHGVRGEGFVQARLKGIKQPQAPIS